MADLLSQFRYQRILAQDSKSKMITLLGLIDGQQAILSAEKTAFDINALEDIFSVQSSFSDVSNNIYHKLFVGLYSDARKRPSAKYSIIYPATETHIKKYTQQKRRMIAETPEIYNELVLPYIHEMVGDRLTWVYNILDHKAETDRILYEDQDPVNGFILLPDLKWDARTLSSLYMICIVHRRDIKSLRDLKGEHIQYLQHLKQECIQAVVKNYDIEEDCLRLYVHYQPSYYHFHIHVQTCNHEAGEGQAIGKAVLLDDIIESLMHSAEAYQIRTLNYTLGEETDLFQRLRNRQSSKSAKALKTLSLASTVSTVASVAEESPSSPGEVEAQLADLNLQREMLLHSMSDLAVNEY